MYDEKTVQRFIELRASGWTYARLMTELNASKPTLIAWSHKYQFEIQNLKAIELESLADHWLASVQDRVKAWGEQLRKVEAELAKLRTDVARVDAEKSSAEAMNRGLLAQLEAARSGETEIRKQLADIERRNVELERRNIDLNDRVNEQTAQIAVRSRSQLRSCFSWDRNPGSCDPRGAIPKPRCRHRAEWGSPRPGNRAACSPE